MALQKITSLQKAAVLQQADAMYAIGGQPEREFSVSFPKKDKFEMLNTQMTSFYVCVHKGFKLNSKLHDPDLYRLEADLDCN